MGFLTSDFWVPIPNSKACAARIAFHRRRYAGQMPFGLMTKLNEPAGPRGWLLLLALCPLISGCVHSRMTEPPRSAVEQLLISTAADRSLAAAMFDTFKGRKVFVEACYFESYDKPYVIGCIRDLLSTHGALLMAEAKEADIIIEPRSGALATDSSSSLIGLPSVPIMVPLSGTLSTPELYLFKSQKQLSVAKLALFAYDRNSHEHVYSSGSLVGKAAHNYYSFIGLVKITRTDLPEKKKPHK